MGETRKSEREEGPAVDACSLTSFYVLVAPCMSISDVLLPSRVSSSRRMGGQLSHVPLESEEVACIPLYSRPSDLPTHIVPMLRWDILSVRL